MRNRHYFSIIGNPQRVRNNTQNYVNWDVRRNVNMWDIIWIEKVARAYLEIVLKQTTQDQICYMIHEDNQN